MRYFSNFHIITVAMIRKYFALELDLVSTKKIYNENTTSERVLPHCGNQMTNDAICIFRAS